MVLKPIRRLSTILLMTAFAITTVVASQQAAAEDQEDHHPPPPREITHHFEDQEVVVEDFAAAGYILAIGGGGEGVIGQLKGDQVVAIDISRRELEGTPGGPLKIVMDARELLFLDESFNTAASFFTLMYIKEADHAKVFDEIYRVLSPGGRFLVWDVIFGERPNPDIEIGVIMLTVKLPHKEISTGYGARWPSEIHDLDYYTQLAEDAGFEVTARQVTGHWFYLEVEKPKSTASR